MRGAVAAGHPLTAAAGADVLRAGGNAVDAAVGAALTSWVAESTVTGPGAGGFMLVHRARDRSTRVFDFFVAIPGLGDDYAEVREMDRIEVDFSGGSTQLFRIGPASCAIPGAPLGLETAHRAFGRLPWAELFAPAIEHARNGVGLTPGQAYLHEILDAILRHTPESRDVYESDGDFLREGDAIVQRDLAQTLELFAEEGTAALYTGELARRLVEHVASITPRDLAEYRVIRRRPVRTAFRGGEFLSNPPPSAGGTLIAYGLGLLDDVGEPGSAEAIDALARVMQAQAGVRATRAIVSRGTTHISVVDGEGNAVALTASTGAGSGVVVPGTGIHLNNMIGEFEVDRMPRPGERLSSSMSPSIVLRDDRPQLVVGSAGSLRLRGAVMQIVVNAVQHELPVRSAIDRPRVHLDGDVLHCEGGHDPAELDRVEAMGWNVARWEMQNLYFGGAAAVGLTSDGELEAAGDPRRGGAGVVVE